MHANYNMQVFLRDKLKQTCQGVPKQKEKHLMHLAVCSYKKKQYI